MPLTFETRLRRALIKLIEDESATTQERLEAAQILQNMNDSRRSNQTPTPKKVKASALLG